MNDPPLAKGDIGGFSKLLNPPFSKGRDANKYMLWVIIEYPPDSYAIELIALTPFCKRYKILNKTIFTSLLFN
jgi:hypothetical protein